MQNAERYPFINADIALGEAGFRPYLPDVCFHRSQLYFEVCPKARVLE